MKTIKLLSQLEIEDGRLVTKTLKKDNEVFLQQGSMDGACGPYCVFMALIILGIVDYSEATNLWSIKRSTKLGKLIKAMQEHRTLFDAGTKLEQLDKMLNQSFKSVLLITTTPDKGKKAINFIVTNLKNEKPVVFGIFGKGLAHWLLAVGYEENNLGVSKIFCLDPSENETANYYNAIIDVQNPRYGYPYQWVNQTDTYVKFDEALSLELKH